MLDLFYFVCDQKCGNVACGRRGKPVGLHSLSCEECKRPLVPIRALDRRAVGACAAAVLGLVLALVLFHGAKSGEKRPPAQREERAAPAHRVNRQAEANRSIAQGNALLGQRRLAEARREFERATESDPASSMAWADLGGAESALGHRDEALRCLGEALRLDARNWLAYYNRGLLSARAGDNEGALHDFGQALAALPDSAERERGALLRELRTAPALADLRKDARFADLMAESASPRRRG